MPLELVQRVTGHKTTDIVLKHYFRPGREEFKRTLENAMPDFFMRPAALPEGMEVRRQKSEDRRDREAASAEGSGAPRGTKDAKVGEDERKAKAEEVTALVAKYSAGTATEDEMNRLRELLKGATPFWRR